VERGIVRSPKVFVWGIVACVACALVSGCGAAGSPQAPRASPSKAPVTIVQALDERGLTEMARIVAAAGLDRRLAATGPYTLVAPDDAAFAVMPAGARARLLTARGRARAFVLDLLLAGGLPRDALRDGLQTLTMYAPLGLAEAGHRLTWTVQDSDALVDGARVSDVVVASNGIVYVVDRPLPPAPEVHARPSRASAGDAVTLVCRWTLADGTPVAGARCILAWHFGRSILYDTVFTDASGVARGTRVVPPDPGTERVLVTVTARGSAPTRTVVTSFAVR
jgi:Fasciclin domain